MSARKKTWVKSAFSQISNLESNNTKESTTPVKATTPTRRSSRRKQLPPASTTITTEIIDLDLIEDDLTQSAKNGSKPTECKNLQTNENWIDTFAPATTDEIAIHPKKLQELEQWFLHCEFMRKKKLPAQMCLLTGPAGSGKTAAIRVLAKTNNYSIQEWINPVDQEMIFNLGDQVYGETPFCSSQVEAFKNFLFKASRYRSLLDMSGGGKRLLLIEDFPNFLLRDPSALDDILQNYSIYGKCPLIFIATDAKRRGLNISYNLFTDQLKHKFQINHISFNPIACTLMQKAIKRFCDLMRLPPHNEAYKPPSSDLTDSIILSAEGDIRNALINLHFSSLKGAPNLLLQPVEHTELSQSSKSSSRKKKKQSTLKSVGRDASLTMMHALGRVFNPKYNENKRLLHKPEDIAEAFVTEPRNLIDLIQANYLPHFQDIDFTLAAADGLSLSDLLLNDYRDNGLTLTGLTMGVRSIMVANEKPVAGWLPVKGLKRLRAEKDVIPIQASKLLPANHNISKNLYAVDYRTFVNIMTVENRKA